MIKTNWHTHATAYALKDYHRFPLNMESIILMLANIEDFILISGANRYNHVANLRSVDKEIFFYICNFSEYQFRSLMGILKPIHTDIRVTKKEGFVLWAFIELENNIFINLHEKKIINYGILNYEYENDIIQIKVV